MGFFRNVRGVKFLDGISEMFRMFLGQESAGVEVPLGQEERESRDR